MIRSSDLARAGCKYLGEKYTTMDCQKFVRQCMADEGLSAPPGSNKLYRTMTWTGTPEECKKKFGRIPVGAFLFIHAFDGGEEARGYHDGKGNASHIGIYTGKTGQEMVNIAIATGNTRAVNYNFGDGAIHSSQSREHVATSNFSGKSIRGGWNKIGLWEKIDYGTKINRILNEKEETEGTGGKMYNAVLSGGNTASPLNMRESKSTRSKLITMIPQGATVTVEAEEGDWALVEYRGTEGYVLSQFVHADEAPASQDPTEHVQPGGQVTLQLTYEQATTLLPALENLVNQLVTTVGRG